MSRKFRNFLMSDVSARIDDVVGSRYRPRGGEVAWFSMAQWLAIETIVMGSVARLMKRPPRKRFDTRRTPLRLGVVVAHGLRKRG
jgi:hypothetical protein